MLYACRAQKNKRFGGNFGFSLEDTVTVRCMLGDHLCAEPGIAWPLLEKKRIINTIAGNLFSSPVSLSYYKNMTRYVCPIDHATHSFMASPYLTVLAQRVLRLMPPSSGISLSDYLRNITHISPRWKKKQKEKWSYHASGLFLQEPHMRFFSNWC